MLLVHRGGRKGGWGHRLFVGRGLCLMAGGEGKGLAGGGRTRGEAYRPTIRVPHRGMGTLDCRGWWRSANEKVTVGFR